MSEQNAIRALVVADDVLVIGELRADIVCIWADDLTDNLTVVVTGRQRAHYLRKHADVVGYERQIPATVLDPDEVHRNKADTQMALFYKQMDDRHYLRVAVLMQRTAGGRRHSILSCRLAGQCEVRAGAQRRVWEKT